MKTELAALRRMGNYERIPSKTRVSSKTCVSSKIGIGPLYIYEGLTTSIEHPGRWMAKERVLVTADFSLVSKPSSNGQVFLLDPRARAPLSCRGVSGPRKLLLLHFPGEVEVPVYALIGDENYAIAYWEKLQAS